MKVEYSSNNSGGSWWLSDEDWYNLEKAGWQVQWVKDDPYQQGYCDEDGRFLGALATSAFRDSPSVDDAIKEWESVTGEDAEDEGCNCCGRPHSFYEED